MKILFRTVLILVALVALGVGLLAGGVYAVQWYYEPELPPVASLRELKLGVPMRVYTTDGRLIGEFGAERRAPLRYEQIPQRLIDAFLAAEDDRFFEHPGFDWRGLLRAGWVLATTGEKTQGGSTITMQLARNVFLTPQRSYERKIKEILLATRIEAELDKKEILEIYLNKIFLGQRAYGVEAAAQQYFGHGVDQLTLSEAAVLAGLPKAPSRDNPLASPERARERRDYVLGRLRALGRISELDYRAAIAEPIKTRERPPVVEMDARYVAEMARAQMVAQFGEAAYSDGLRVVTTIDSRRQLAMNEALRGALLDYDQRHGWRGPETRLPDDLLRAEASGDQRIDDFLTTLPIAAGLVPAAVVDPDPAALKLLAQDLGVVTLSSEDLAWAKLSSRNTLKRGDVVRIRREGERYRLAQLPEAEAAMIALDPHDGAIQALQGGYDFLRTKYNRVVQALRQPGSGFKPILYAAAFDFGFTPASVVLDAPVVFADANLETTWRPQNYGGDFKGPMRLREALVHSRNLVSVRLAQSIGVDYARDYATRFGLPKDRIPRDLSMSLGSGVFTPLEMARAYAVFANGGFLIEPYFIAEVRDGRGELRFKAQPKRACPECAAEIVAAGGDARAGASAAVGEAPRPDTDTLAPRAVDPRIAWLVGDVLREVTIRGTAAKARELGRGDIAGKTGTSNDETDAWFNGYTPDLVAVSWVGFDQPRPMGRGEVGGRAALPMWMDFMRAALAGVPESRLPRPGGLVSVRIDPATGLLATTGGPAIFETVQAEHVPPPAAAGEERRGAEIQDLF